MNFILQKLHLDKPHLKNEWVNPTQYFRMGVSQLKLGINKPAGQRGKIQYRLKQCLGINCMFAEWIKEGIKSFRVNEVNEFNFGQYC